MWILVLVDQSPRTKPIPPDLKAFAAARVKAVGLRAAADECGMSRLTILSAAHGLDVTAGAIAQLMIARAKHDGSNNDFFPELSGSKSGPEIPPSKSILDRASKAALRGEPPEEPLG